MLYLGSDHRTVVQPHDGGLGGLFAGCRFGVDGDELGREPDAARRQLLREHLQ
jgi:hypothetical protein